MAPVKDPFSCPKSSESIVPSGIAPQFTAMYFLCFLAQSDQTIILGKNSFPEPLSPVTSTERSIGATRMARAMARINAGELPIIENRCFAAATSAGMS